MPDIIVKNSAIHGRGIFAARDFKKGEVVLRWNMSHPVSAKDILLLPETEKAFVNYNHGNPILMQPPERFLNHSCEPNTCINDYSDVAIRDIKKGEEVTGDYSEDLTPGMVLRCACGSKKCRKIIMPSDS